MKLYLIVLLLTTLKLRGAKFITSKVSKSKLPQNAIIAIQIIDPHENKTDTKNSKRTIESSLGYGYQDNYVGRQVPSPKYEIYKYSQHDIPPYTRNDYNVQSNNYQVPSRTSKPQHNAGISNFYQPGTIVFSTINQRGQLGELSSKFPVSLEDQQHPIPVIILRVHPDQLANPLYPQLPQNHLHATTINSIDINSLLSSFIGNSLKEEPAVQAHSSTHQQPTIQQQPAVYQQSAVYHEPHVHQQALVRQQPVVQQQSVMYQQQYQQEYQNAQTYEQPQHQQEVGQYQVPDYQSQQYYPQYQYEETQDVGQSYQSPPDVSVLPEPRTPETGGNYQYSSYQVPSPVYEQPAVPVESHKSKGLLIEENYPSDKHTQVIFKRSKGKSSNRNKQAHTSASAHVHSRRPHVSSPESQPENEKIRQPAAPNYLQPNSNYYTIQYSEDQGYTHQKAPSYGEKDRGAEGYKDVQAQPNENYVYISSDPTYNQDI